MYAVINKGMDDMAQAESEDSAKAQAPAGSAPAGSAPAGGGDELPKLRSQGERLKLERDNAQLHMELAQLNRPWWRKSATVTVLTAIIAAVLPVTTAIQARYEKEREIALQEGKQAHEIRTSYLDRLRQPNSRLRTLRFVLATTTDPSLRAWAEEEKKVVDTEISELRREIADDRDQIETLEKASTQHGSGLQPTGVEELLLGRREDLARKLTILQACTSAAAE